MQVRFLPRKGWSLRAGFDVAQRIRLDGVLDKARAELGVPVVFDVVASFEKKRPQAEVRREAAAPQQAEAGDVPAPQADDMPEIRVTGVTLTPMRFISLATGQRRVFEGGLLPGGYVLESIGVKELKLRKDGRIIVYRLRGSNE